MEIRNFDRVRIGSGYPAVLDISPIEGHESYGIAARFYDAVLDEDFQVELRRKENDLALFLFRYGDMELPNYWQDSELVWSLASDRKRREKTAKTTEEHLHDIIATYNNQRGACDDWQAIARKMRDLALVALDDLLDDELGPDNSQK